MKRVWILVTLAGVVLAGGAYVTASGGEAGGSASEEGDKARATLRNADDEKVGTVKLEQDGDTVKLKVKVDGSVAPGFHGFHVHGVGACVGVPPVTDPVTPPFTSAGSHYNPGGDSVKHDDHAGDLPLLLIDGDGEAEARFATDRFALDALLEGDGSAFILHANADNYANIPVVPYGGPVGGTLNTGDAGGRIACGVVESD
jgi:Cu-Zn family superoxide dismutase